MSLDPEVCHHTTIAVRYAETDQMRFVYHANHLVYFEVARTEALARLGLPYAELEARGVAIPVLSVQCDYLAPARYGDELLVLTTSRMLDRLRVRFDYEIRRASPAGELLSQGHTVHACMDPSGRPIRPPADLVAALGKTFSV